MNGPEAGFREALVDAAHVYGWKVAFFRPARTNKGWRTAVGADGAGWPDLVLCRRGRIQFAELKAKGKRPTEAQQAWLDVLGGCTTEADVWTESDWVRIEQVLR